MNPAIIALAIAVLTVGRAAADEGETRLQCRLTYRPEGLRLVALAESDATENARLIEIPAVSGPFGKGCLPNGWYKVLPPAAPARRSARRIACPRDVRGAWILPVIPQFETERNNLGIHPNPSATGTLGCVGLRCEDSDDFLRSIDRCDLDSMQMLVDFPVESIPQALCTAKPAG